MTLGALRGPITCILDESIFQGSWLPARSDDLHSFMHDLWSRKWGSKGMVGYGHGHGRVWRSGENSNFLFLFPFPFSFTFLYVLYLLAEVYEDPRGFHEIKLWNSHFSSQISLERRIKESFGRFKAARLAPLWSEIIFGFILKGIFLW